MSTVEISRPQKFVLYGEPWESYIRLLRIFEERRHLRITYDRGALEIMTLSPEHEQLKHLIGWIIIALAEELRLPLAGYGSMTMKRRKEQKGLEADECYWIQNEAQARNLSKCFKPLHDPPPDLVVEVDLSRSAVNRLRIYATLGVPEVWRFRKEKLQFLLLGEDGKYLPQAASRAFPGIPADEINRVLGQRGQTDNNTLIREFREWVRARAQ